MTHKLIQANPSEPGVLEEFLQFSMLVEKIFNFQDGRTVFVGGIYDCDSFIQSCDCDLYIDKKYFSTVTIEGEMIAKGNQTTLRSLSSTDKIDTSKILSYGKEVQLICKE